MNTEQTPTLEAQRAELLQQIGAARSIDEITAAKKALKAIDEKLTAARTMAALERVRALEQEIEGFQAATEDMHAEREAARERAPELNRRREEAREALDEAETAWVANDSRISNLQMIMHRRADRIDALRAELSAAQKALQDLVTA